MTAINESTYQQVYKLKWLMFAQVGEGLGNTHSADIRVPPLCSVFIMSFFSGLQTNVCLGSFLLTYILLVAIKLIPIRSPFSFGFCFCFVFFAMVNKPSHLVFHFFMGFKAGFSSQQDPKQGANCC